mgnify:CR=1 FL=1
MRPTFLGIGVPRGGSTWLYEVLDAHPDVYVSQQRKEVHFFDRSFDKGWAWYESFFPAEAGRYLAVGEVTPHYIYSQEAMERIRATPSITRLITTLRDPVERAFSHYTWRMQHDNYRGDFRSFLADYPEAVEWGRYSSHLERCFGLFPRESVLVLVCEHAFADVPGALRRIAEHLGVDAGRFPAGTGGTRVNTAVSPRSGAAYKVASRVGAFMRRHDLYWINKFAVNLLGVKRLLGREGKGKPRLTPEDRAVRPDPVRGRDGARGVAAGREPGRVAGVSRVQARAWAASLVGTLVPCCLLYSPTIQS